jgi:C-terminal processing protease CtpA/Prc
LGKVIWQAPEDNHFHAYIFKTKDGRKNGFLRIAAYDSGSKENKQYAEIIAKFKAEGIKALVIDQTHNPGGSVFDLYKKVSHLSGNVMKAPRHNLVIDEGDAKWAADLLLKIMRASGAQEAAPKADDGKDADEDEGWSGYPVTEKFMVLMVQFAQFIIKQLGAGKRFTDLTHLWGVDDIDPAPNEEERLPDDVEILLLTDALDFSGGDFFPAIMKDNERATLMGVRTAGAGGAVKPYSIPNQFGIAGLNATWTIAQRTIGQPIENLGITPHVDYKLTQRDFRTGFGEWRLAILKTLDDMLAKKPTAKPKTKK